MDQKIFQPRNQVVRAAGSSFQFGLARKIEQLTRKFRRAICRFPGRLQVVIDFVAIFFLSCRRGEFNVSLHAHQQIVEFVGNPHGEPSHRVHFL